MGFAEMQSMNAGDRCALMLCACLFSGGESRRMGQDKALLPHPSGGLWLTALVDQVRLLGLPLQVVSRHPAHGDQLADRPGVTVVQEPPPWQGPLQALGRVLPGTPAEALLVLPVDMPRLSAAVLQQLINAWYEKPDQIAVAQDGKRLQPLLAVIPTGEPFQTRLAEQLARGERRWMAWLASVPHRPVVLPSQALLNANCPEDLAALMA